MGRFADWLFGSEESGPQDWTPEARSGDPDEPELPTPNVDQALIIPRRESGTVSAGDALGMISVYRATQVISTSVMQLSLDAIKDDQPLAPKPLLLRRPDSDESLSAFLEKTTLSLALNGNAFWRVYRDNQGRVTGVRVLNPLDVTIQTDGEGRVTGYQYARRETPFTTTEVKHLSHMRVAGDPRGRGPIQAAQAELRGAIDARDYAAFWFDEAGVPTGLLTTDQNLTAESAERAKERWTDTQGGQRGVAVLGNGFRYTPVYLSPEDAQWIQVRQFDTTAVSRLFGVPAGLMLSVVEGNSMTYANISQAWTEFARFTLTRYTREIEEAFSDLLPRGTEARFNLEALLRPDTVTRWTIHTQALTAGVLSINEVRAIENLPPIPGGDHKTEEEVAQEKAQGVAAAAEAATEAPADEEAK